MAATTRAHDHTLTDAGARTLRRHWFVYLDTVEPERAVLHGYCVKLTGNLWDAEDLLQDTLLRGFAMTARGDFHGPDSPVRDRRAYLLRTATNLWLDQVRRGRWRGPMEEAEEAAQAAAADPDPVATTEALTRAVALTSAREFAALLLKDVYEFSLEDIADFIGTTVGTVKSALSRARGKVRRHAQSAAADPATRALARAFAEALDAGDVDRVLGLMAEAVKIDVCNVGGGRGRSGIWTEKSLVGNRFEYAEVAGDPVILLFTEHDRVLNGLIRIEGERGAVTRLVDYHYAPETLGAVAATLGLECRTRGCHQDPEQLPGMIGSTRLPWQQ